MHFVYNNTNNNTNNNISFHLSFQLNDILGCNVYSGIKVFTIGDDVTPKRVILDSAFTPIAQRTIFMGLFSGEILLMNMEVDKNCNQNPTMIVNIDNNSINTIASAPPQTSNIKYIVLFSLICFICCFVI